jgi:hypothetical protein
MMLGAFCLLSPFLLATCCTKPQKDNRKAAIILHRVIYHLFQRPAINNDAPMKLYLALFFGSFLIASDHVSSTYLPIRVAYET